MQITITGPRGCGKTIAAVEIAKFLRERGCDVRIVGDGRAANDFLRDAIECDSNPDSMYLPLPVTIVDSFERHDENAIRQISERLDSGSRNRYGFHCESIQIAAFLQSIVRWLYEQKWLRR